MRRSAAVLLGVFLFALGLGLGGAPTAYLVARRDLSLGRAPNVRQTVLARETEVTQARRVRLVETLEEQISEYELVPSRYAGSSADAAQGLWRRYVAGNEDERNRLASAPGSARTIQGLLDLHRSFVANPDNELLRRYVDWRTRQGLDEFRGLADYGSVEEFVEWLLAQEYR